MTGASGGVVPDTVPVTVANALLKPSGTVVVTGSGLPRTVGSLFPYTTGDSLWAGDCADADPKGQKPNNGGPYYPGANRPMATALSPGQTTSAATLGLPTVRVSVTHNGAPLNGATLTAIHDPDTNSCTGGDSLPVPGTTGTGNLAGVLLASLPYGNWRFNVTGPGGLSGTTGYVTLTPSTSTVQNLSVDI